MSDFKYALFLLNWLSKQINNSDNNKKNKKYNNGNKHVLAYKINTL